MVVVAAAVVVVVVVAAAAAEVERTGRPGSVPSPGWPSPGLPPQEGLDGQGDAAAAVLLLALRALPLHHDGGSWESYCRTQRWLLSGCLLCLLLLRWFSPTLIPSFPEEEPALPAPSRVLLPSAPPLAWNVAAGGGEGGGAGARRWGRPEELSASPFPLLPTFSTSHCGQRLCPRALRLRRARGW